MAILTVNQAYHLKITLEEIKSTLNNPYESANVGLALIFGLIGSILK